MEPIYANTKQEGYYYARSFTAKFLGLHTQGERDDPISYQQGDIFLALDSCLNIRIFQKDFYKKLRENGVKVQCIVYDLLSIHFPNYFPPARNSRMKKFLYEVVAESDGAVCISKTIANELSEWIASHAPDKKNSLPIKWFHLGADIENSQPTKGVPAEASNTLQRIYQNPTFLLVSTLVPRKGHQQLLEAFEKLWAAGRELNLVFVGRYNKVLDVVGEHGWEIKGLTGRIKNHPEYNKRLFWLEGISDEYLEKVYDASTCLICASEGEGFSLPLIEAAQHKLPIITRDIPIFKEVVGKYGYYFSGKQPEDLAKAIEKWLNLYQKDQYPKSDAMPYLTWKESTQQLIKALEL